MDKAQNPCNSESLNVAYTTQIWYNEPIVVVNLRDSLMPILCPTFCVCGTEQDGLVVRDIFGRYLDRV
jgi:hypothetical protein